MDKKMWEKCVEFHGHECPGLAIGFKACELAIKNLGLEFSKDEELVCVTENDACGVDAVQVLCGCSFGKGNLIYRDRGKQAFSFFKRNTGQSARFVLKNMPRSGDKEQRKNQLLNTPSEELFDVKTPEYELPERARIFNSIICEKCKERTAENKIRISDGKNVCLDCFSIYTRGW